MSDCGTVSNSNATHLTYTNAVQFNHGIINSIISRKRKYLIRFSCSFPKEKTLSTSGVMASLAHVEIHMDEAELKIHIYAILTKNYACIQTNKFLAFRSKIFDQNFDF